MFYSEFCHEIGRNWQFLSVEGDESWVRKPHNRTEKHQYTASKFTKIPKPQLQMCLLLSLKTQITMPLTLEE